MSDATGPIRSMTGFARVREATPEGELVVSLKSVNHRGLDLRFQTSAEMDPYENGMRALLGKRLGRGHVDVRISLVRAPGAGSVGLNRPLLAAYVKAHREASAECGAEAPPDVDAVLRVPEMLVAPVEREMGSEFERTLMGAVGKAADALNAFREREGLQLVEEMRPRVERIRTAATRIGELRAEALPLFQARLVERLGELLETAGIEPQRLAQEAAILADRSDVGEELARLGIHAAQMLEILAGGGEVGKRLDFLAQEMQRETNTILSKTNGVGEAGLRITDEGLAAKAEIEKIREQAMNLE